MGRGPWRVKDSPRTIKEIETAQERISIIRKKICSSSSSSLFLLYCSSSRLSASLWCISHPPIPCFATLSRALFLSNLYSELSCFYISVISVGVRKGVANTISASDLQIWIAKAFRYQQQEIKSCCEVFSYQGTKQNKGNLDCIHLLSIQKMSCLKMGITGANGMEMHSE